MMQLMARMPPFSSMIVHHLEGGFACTVPPGVPVVARESGDVAVVVHAFLGHTSPSELTDVPALLDTVAYGWPKASVLKGSFFSISKLPRVKKGKLVQQGGYMVTYNAALTGTQTQFVAFNRATVMDQLRQWITMPALDAPETDLSLLSTLVGMRLNFNMVEGGDEVFVMEVQHAAQVVDFAGPCSYVARCEDPAFVVGIVDGDVVDYLDGVLGEDSRGEFAVRIHDRYLEFGPRVDDDGPEYYEDSPTPFDD